MERNHPGFFQDKSHERAKKIFKYVYTLFFNLDVKFVNPRTLRSPTIDLASLQDIVLVVPTHGVEHDIPKAARQHKIKHLYQVASQANAAEAPNPFTPGIGTAMTISECDKTQGPLAQRTNPHAFELVLAFLTHLGFNMFEHSLPSAGKTHEVNSGIADGYLRPSKATIGQLSKEMEKNLSKSEYVVYQSKLGEGNPVDLILQAAPAIGYSPELFDALPLSTEQARQLNELEHSAAFANFSALFEHAIQVASQPGSPQVVVHLNAPGTGVFQNKPENLMLALKNALLLHGKDLRKWLIKIHLEVYTPTNSETYLGEGAMRQIGRGLGFREALPPTGWKPQNKSI